MAEQVPQEGMEDHSGPTTVFGILKDIIYSKSYKHFALKLFCFGMIWLFVAGSFGLELRTQAGFSFTGNLLPLEELGYSTIAYFQMMTYHAVVMFFGTIFTTGFSIAFYVVPLIRGTKKLAVPWMANLGHWLVVAGLLMVMGSNSQYMFTFLIPLKNPSSFYVAEAVQFVGDELLIVALLAQAYINKRPNEKFSIPVSFIVMDCVAMGIGIITVLSAIIWTILSPLGGFNIDVFAIPNVEVFRAAFWFESHPLVYFGAFLVGGLTVWFAMIYAKRPIYSERMIRYIIAILFVLTMSVYIHHMAEDPIPIWIRDVFAQVATELIAVPFVLLWTLILITLKYSKPRWDASLLFLVAAIAGNIIGGATAEPLQPIPAADFVVHNTMWIPGHIHFMMATFTLGSFFAILYYAAPELLGRKLYSQGLAKFHFIGWTVGMGALEAAFKVQGAEGLVRREIAWLSIYEPWFQMAMIGAWLAALSVVGFATNMLMTWRYGEPIAPNLIPRWVIAGLTLEEQSRTNEGTHNPNLMYSRIPYPVGLQTLPSEHPSPIEIITPIRVGQSFSDKVATSFKTLIRANKSGGFVPTEKKSE
ncbi:MAG TPA: cbb3-type cytochrome c oxidase subunit I [Nitrososphaerales archaeon]|nr:cbb3-type cytochrome c oxidase subunit I [Nitrososphaerales archaeon]